MESKAEPAYVLLLLIVLILWIGVSPILAVAVFISGLVGLGDHTY